MIPVEANRGIISIIRCSDALSHPVKGRSLGNRVTSRSGVQPFPHPLCQFGLRHRVAMAFIVNELEVEPAKEFCIRQIGYANTQFHSKIVIAFLIAAVGNRRNRRIIPFLNARQRMTGVASWLCPIV